MKITKIIPFLVGLLFFCCNKKNIQNKPSNLILTFLEASKNKSINFEERLSNINNAYSLVGRNVDSISLAVLYQKTKIHYDLEQFDSVSFYNKLLKKGAYTINSAYYKARYHYIQSYYYDYVLQKKDSAFYHGNQAKESYIKINDSLSTGEQLTDLALMQLQAGDFHGSIAYATESLLFFSKPENLLNIADAYNIIASNYEQLKLSKEAIINYEKAIQLASNYEDQLIFKNNLATFYSGIKKFDESINLLKSLPLGRITNLEHKALIIDNLNFIKWLKNSKLNIESELIKAQYIRENEDDLWGLVDSYEHLAKYFTSKNVVKSIYYTNKLIEASKKSNYTSGELKGLKILMSINQEDVTTRNRYISLNDSLNLAQLQTRNQYAKIKYDNQQVLTENETLKQKNQRQRLYKVIGFLALGIFVLGASFFFYGLYRKHKEEKQKIVHATENKISKHIHDDVAGGLFQIMMKIQNRARVTTESLLDSVEVLYLKARDYSHQISEVDTTHNYPTFLKGMLHDFNSNKTSVAVSGIQLIPWNSISDLKKEVLYKVLNELMINMKKHSEAEVVAIKFKKQGKKLYTHYYDDGIGLTNNMLDKGLGVKNVENRIKSVHGTFNFDKNYSEGVHAIIIFNI